MMNFFKKETKEDKEKKKIEKKSLKDTSLIINNSGSTTMNTSLTLTKQLVNDSDQQKNYYQRYTSENSKKIDHVYSNNKISENNLNEDLNNSPTFNNNNSLIMPSITTTKTNHSVNSSLIEINSTTPSIIQTNSLLSAQQILPKPKKGILKTMSKFGIGPTLSNITSTTQQQQQTTSPSNQPPKPAVRTSKLNESIIPNYSKRNSQMLIHDLNSSQSTVINQTSKSSNKNQLNNNVNFMLPSLHSLPIYLNDPNQIKFDNGQFIRILNVSADLLKKLELIQLDEDETEEDLSSLIFITCDLSLNLDFLPGDQLIAINGQNVLGKNINEAKYLLEQNYFPDSTTLIPIQVRTSLKCSELFTRNICDSIYYRKLSSNQNIDIKQSLNSLSSSSISSNSSSTVSSTIGITNNDETETDSVWLVHTNGYSYVKIISKTTSNDENSMLNDANGLSKFRVKLENGNIIEVNEENLEKINPSPQFDFCEDLSRLRFINESSLIHAIRQRYHTLKLIHTNIGSNCLLILKSSTVNSNPINLELLSTNPTSVYNDRIISKFKGKKIDDMPPHIYSYTHSVYRSMLSTRQDQSIILMGHSGSAKTYNSKLILNYLFKIATPNLNKSNSLLNSNNFTEIKLNALYCLLNAFCCVSTDKNISGSNRFLNIFLLEFNHSGQLASILLQLIALDYTRLIYQQNNESNFLIFYYLLYGADFSLKSELQLNNISITKDKTNLLFHSDIDSKITIDHSKESFQKLLESFKLLNFTDNEIKTVISLIAAIIHLSRADATKNPSPSFGRTGQFLNPNEAHKAANLLGITFQQLNDSVFSILNNSMQSNTNQNKYGHLSNNGSARISPDPNSNSNLDPVECLQGFCIGLYQECLNLIVNFVNRAFKPLSNSLFNYQQPISNSMLIIDPPGFQYHPVNSNIKTNSASYSDLMCNYLSERFQLMFYQINFINPIEKCAQEGLDIDLVEHIPESPSALVNWFDKPSAPTSILSQRNSVNQSNTTCGLLGLLEEQISSEFKSSKQFLRKLIDSDQKQNFLSANESDTNFTIHHQFGLFPVEYNLDNWLELFCKDYPTHRNALTILHESKKEIFLDCVKQSLALSNAAAAFNNNSISFSSISSNTNSDSNQQHAASSLKRQASVRKMLTMSKRKSFKVNFKLQLDSIFDSMRRTKCNFVFCILPVQNVQNQLNQQQSFMLSEKLDVPLLRSQLKAHQILAACRIYRQGYPEHLNFEEFERRFSMFIVQNSNDSLQYNNSIINDDHKQACINLIKIFDLDPAFVKFGTTQIFFKAGILNKLNDKRDEKLNDLIIKLQANCKRYLAIKQLEKRKIKDSAIKCIQKNVRISFALKKWKWWRLYTQLMPIINVQNNETLFKQCKEELDELKRKNERLNNEKNELKLLNNQLENKLMNLQTEYVEEHAANAGTLDLLDVETSERMRLEREINELRPAYNESLKKIENLETEMLEMRLFATKKSIEHELEKDDIDGLSTPIGENEFPIHIEKIKRENEILKQKLFQDKENTQLFNQGERNFFESKLKEKDNEILEFEKQIAVHKRKYQKLNEDMQDVQRLCDESKVRNRELEKIQIKFDSEMSFLRNKYEREKESREKCEREREAFKYEIFSLKNDLDTQKLETSYHVEKCERLERDLKEYESINLNTTNGSNNQSNDQFMKMKSQIRDMESKLKDQEEELDDQQGTIQQLEQTKLRLEMQFEKEKQKFQRELAEKESEMDDLRFHTQKKIKAIEMQLEEESELTNNLQREKRDVERKLREATVFNNGKKGNLMIHGLSNNNDLFEYINKLKRNMTKYKTLAIDAQTQLEKLRENLPKQSIIKALKLQLEDSEISKANALKTKQLLQVEISDLQQQLDDLNFSKQNLEEQNIHLNRELNNLKSQLEEQERDADDSLKKYQNHIQNYSLDSHRFIDLNNQIDLITIENRILKEKIREMEEKVNYYENAYVDKSVMNKLESKLRDLECKLDLELSHKTRLQNQLERIKQQNEKSIFEIDTLSSREKKCEEMLKKSQRQYKDTLEEFGDIRKKLIDLEETKKRLEQQNEILERELESARGEIKINQNRIDAFQNAFNSMNNEDDDDDAQSDNEYEDEDDYESEGINSDNNENIYSINNRNHLNATDRLNLSFSSTVNGNNK